MANKTGIEWTEATWNPDSVYHGREFSDVACHPERLDQPIRWQKPRMIFVNSMSDLFHEKVPFKFVAAVFAIMASTPQHTYQILTKRPRRMLKFFDWLAQNAEGANERYFSSDYYQGGVKARQKLRDQGKASLDEPAPPTEMLRGLYDIAVPIINKQMDQDARFHHLRSLGEHHWRQWPLDNVWIGVSVEDQKTANQRIPLLMRTPAAVRWLSMEPLLGHVDIDRAMYGPEKKRKGLSCFGFTDGFGYEALIDWIVVGGESGPNARPMHPHWATAIRDQCRNANVPYLFKQWGEWAPRSEHYHILTNGSSACEQDPQSQKWSCIRLTESGGNGRDLGAVDGGCDVYMQKVGKKLAGRELLGQIHDGYPAARKAPSAVEPA